MSNRTVPTSGERVWQGALYVLSASMAASGLADFSAGRFGSGVGAFGAAVLMLSLMVQFPFLRAVVQASKAEASSPERLRQQQHELKQQADKTRAAHPWAELANRAGWTLLLLSLVLRLTGVA